VFSRSADERSESPIAHPVGAIRFAIVPDGHRDGGNYVATSRHDCHIAVMLDAGRDANLRADAGSRRELTMNNIVFLNESESPSFAQDEIVDMALAVDDVCKVLEIPPEDAPTLKSIAERVVEHARRGERDPEVLAERVISELRSVESPETQAVESPIEEPMGRSLESAVERALAGELFPEERPAEQTTVQSAEAPRGDKVE
jgi:hypothetical protein